MNCMQQINNVTNCAYCEKGLEGRLQSFSLIALRCVVLRCVVLCCVTSYWYVCMSMLPGQEAGRPGVFPRVRPTVCSSQSSLLDVSLSSSSALNNTNDRCPGILGPPKCQGAPVAPMAPIASDEAPGITSMTSVDMHSLGCTRSTREFPSVGGVANTTRTSGGTIRPSLKLGLLLGPHGDRVDGLPAAGNCMFISGDLGDFGDFGDCRDSHDCSNCGDLSAGRDCRCLDCSDFIGERALGYSACVACNKGTWSSCL